MYAQCIPEILTLRTSNKENIQYIGEFTSSKEKQFPSNSSELM